MVFYSYQSARIDELIYDVLPTMSKEEMLQLAQVLLDQADVKGDVQNKVAELLGLEELTKGGEQGIDYEAPYELSENQKLFCRDVNDSGLEVDFHYSARHSYGKECPSVDVQDVHSLDTESKVSYDNMGLGFVIYATN